MRAFKTSVQRKIFIDKKIRDKTYPSATSLAKDFEKENNKKIDPRTIASDISELRHKYKAPIKYDSKKRGYFYSTDDFFLNIFDGEADTYFNENIALPHEMIIPDWQRMLLLSFMKEVLPECAEENDTKESLSNSSISVLPSVFKDSFDASIETSFINALKTKVALTLEVVLEKDSIEKYDFIPLHLICQGEYRLYFGKRLSGDSEKVETYCLLNLSLVKTAAIAYSSLKDLNKFKEIADDFSNIHDTRFYSVNKEESEDGEIQIASYYAQTIGHNDVEIIMTESRKKSIYVFSCYPSLRDKEDILRYQKVGEFVLFR